MKILLTGASGFIGSRLRAALAARGHELLCVGRRRPHDHVGHWRELDLVEARDAAAWRPLLGGVDAVVNAVGIFREHGRQTFTALHLQAPAALFEACAQCGVQRVVQLSALGADAAAVSDYQRSKAAADERLLALPLDAVVAQPSLVFGTDGPSARLFLGLAALPLLPLPAGGGQPLQPIHVDDAVAALVALVEAEPGRWRGRRVALVGPSPLTLADYLQALRAALGLPPAPTVAVPAFAMVAAARLGDRRSRSLLDSASWRMLERGSVADAADVGRLLGHAPRAPHQFVDAACRAALRARVRLHWLLPMLRGSLAFVWIFTGIVSLGLYPRQDSYALLAGVGVPAALQAPALFSAAALDLLLGVLTLMPMRARRRRRLWQAQATLIVAYTAVITLWLPAFWLHPFGPLTKNMPMLAVLLLLHALDDPAEDPAWTT